MEVGLANADDMEILEFATQNRRVCVTFDHDFHAHRRSRGRTVIRHSDPRGGSEFKWAGGADSKGLWASCSDAIDAGAAVSVDEIAIRVRNLPLR